MNQLTDSSGGAAAISQLGDSDAFLEFQEDLARAARAERPVILVGERGTGKELAAARLHYLSRRWQGPLATLNCAALAASLLESELFGHEAGAFTGAVRQRPGRFEAADSGSLFLDEIGLTPLALQEKILRVVEYGVFERVGGTRSVSVDVRLIAATNQDLPSLAAKGRFKADLLDRLSFLVLTLPPLRAREGDVLLLARHFASRMAIEISLEEPPRFSGRAEAALLSHSWPGNVRELKNVVERAVFTSAAEPGGLVDEIILDPFASPYRPRPEKGAPAVSASPMPHPGPEPDFSLPLPEQVKKLKLRLLDRALKASDHHQGRAAELLGLSYNQFRNLFRSLGGELRGERGEKSG